MSVQEIPGSVPGLRFPPGVKTMVNALRYPYFGVGPSLGKGAAQRNSLRNMNRSVARTVGHTEGRRTMVNVGDRRRATRGFGMLARGKAQQRFHASLDLRKVVEKDGVREVAWASGRDHSTRRTAVRGIGLGFCETVVGHKPHERGQVASGRSTEDGYKVRVDSILHRVGPQPTNRALAVYDLRGPPRLARQAIAEAGDRETVRRQYAQVLAVVRQVATAPASPVNVEYAGERVDAGVFRYDKIQFAGGRDLGRIGKRAYLPDTVVLHAIEDLY